MQKKQKNADTNADTPRNKTRKETIHKEVIKNALIAHTGSYFHKDLF